MTLRILPLLFLATICSCEESATGQSTAPKGLAFSISNTGQAYGKAACDDINDNFYYTTFIQGAASGKNLTIHGLIDTYFAKHDRAGNLILERSFGAPQAITVAHAMETDAQGNVYLTGYFGSDNIAQSRTINFGNGVTATSSGGFDSFVVKYSSSGEALWAFAVGNVTAGNATEERTWDMSVAPDGSFVISGAGNGTINLNPLGTAVLKPITGTGHFFARYNKDGIHLWSHTFNANITNLFNEGYSTVDEDANGNIFLSAVFRNQIDVAGQLLASAGTSDFFIAKFGAANGNVIAVKAFGGSGIDVVSPGAMRLNSAGEPHLTGRFSGAGNFGGVALNGSGTASIFVLSCNANLGTKWAISLNKTSSGIDGGHRVDFDNNDHVYVAGWFTGSVDFDGKQGVATLTSNGIANAGDVFLAKYDGDGNHLWSHHFGASANGGEQLAICAGLAVDGYGDAIITGRFYGTADFDPHPNQELLLVSSGMDDCFVAKYKSDGTLFTN